MSKKKVLCVQFGSQCYVPLSTLTPRQFKALKEEFGSAKGVTKELGDEWV